MPPKPLEAMLEKFHHENFAGDPGKWILFKDAGEDFIKKVWSEALIYGAELITNENVCNSDEHCYCPKVSALLLEEADKATKNV